MGENKFDDLILASLGGGSLIERIRYKIMRDATTEEDALIASQNVLQDLTQKLNSTNWNELFADKKVSEEKKHIVSVQRGEFLSNLEYACKKCRRKFKRRELASAKVYWEDHLYCPACLTLFIKEHSYMCLDCCEEFVSHLPKKRCSKCRINDRQKEQRTISKHLHRARKAKQEATLTVDEWLITLQFFEGNCAYCRTYPYDELEHFLPLSDKEWGGGTTVDNCVPACKRCHKGKLIYNPRFRHMGFMQEFPIGMTTASFDRVEEYLRSRSKDK